MPWIKQIDENKAEGKLKEVYESLASNRGKISNIMKVHSLDPETMKNHLDMYMSIMFIRKIEFF